METLENNYLRGDKGCYLEDINKAYVLLINWKNDWKNDWKNISRVLEDTSYDGIYFLQTDTSKNKLNETER